MNQENHPAEQHLSAYQSGELSPEERASIAKHLQHCDACQQHIHSFAQLDRLCAQDPTPVLEPKLARDILRDVLQEQRNARVAKAPSDIMTLEEVASFLRVTPQELEWELDSLPVFSFAGRLRIRRDRLLDWIQEREQHSRNRRLYSRIHTSLHKT